MHFHTSMKNVKNQREGEAPTRLGHGRVFVYDYC